ncbi:MAG: exodeoxyribonuclease VII small subunit [Pirellulales bacterium]|nr:exodeoxyribonuclease VII small subunit [Pirellulales bacterium]
MSVPDDSPPAPSDLSFEQALTRLDEIAMRLEDQRLGLNESLGLYEEGVSLLKKCQNLLAGAERKIELLTGLDAGGQPLTQPFADTATFAAPTSENSHSPEPVSAKKRPGPATSSKKAASATPMQQPESPLQVTPPTKSAKINNLAPWEDDSFSKPGIDDTGNLF